MSGIPEETVAELMVRRFSVFLALGLGMRHRAKAVQHEVGLQDRESVQGLGMTLP